MAMQFIIKNLRALEKLGQAFQRGANAGIRRIADEIYIYMKTVPPESISKDITRERISEDHERVGSTEALPEEKEDGAKEIKQKCTTHEFRFVHVRVEYKDKEEEYMRQAVSDVVRSGRAKTIILEEIARRLERILG